MTEEVRNARFLTSAGDFIDGEWLHPVYGWIPHSVVRGESEIMDAVFDAYLALPPAPYVEPALDLERLAAEVRAERDARVRETDWMVLPDAPLTAAEQDKVLIYRQLLRDVPAQPGFPLEVVWPTLNLPNHL